MEKKGMYLPPVAEMLYFRTGDILNGSPDDTGDDGFDETDNFGEG